MTGKPTAKEWGAALRDLATLKSGVQWALGDMMLLAAERKWDDEDIQTAMDATGLKPATFANYRTVARRFPPDRRRLTVPWSHYALVTALDDEQAEEILSRAEEESWGWEEVRAHAKEKRAKQRRLAQAFPEGTFGIILATPPWRRGIGDPNTLMPDEVASLAPKVQAVTAPAAVLYLSVPHELLEEGLTVVRAWGFKPVGSMARVSSLTARVGPWVRERHEFVLIATRGHAVPPEEDTLTDSVAFIAAFDAGYGSVYDAIEQAYGTDTPKIRLFTDEERSGWATWNYTMEAAHERGITLRDAAPASVPA